MQRRWVFFGFCAALLAGVAAGHARLLGEVPAAGAELDASPAALTLRFNEKVRLAVLTLTAAGREIPLAVDRNAAPAATVSVGLPRLAAGHYDVQWSALTDSDGHVVKGAYSFVVR
jgi:methionine-rich copper-binding protein CopC